MRWVALGAVVYATGWLAYITVQGFLGIDMTYESEEVLTALGILSGLFGGITGAIGVNIISENPDRPAAITRHIGYAIAAALIILSGLQLVAIVAGPEVGLVHLIFAAFMSVLGAACGQLLWQHFDSERAS